MLYWILGVGVLSVDQLSKIFIRRLLSVGESIPVLPGVLYFTRAENTGAAFGLLPQSTALLTAITALLFVAAFWWRDQLRLGRGGVAIRWAYAVGLAGAAGNFIDRLLHGSVTDFIDLRIFPIFNVADIAITGAALLLAWLFLRTDTEADGSRRESNAR